MSQSTLQPQSKGPSGQSIGILSLILCTLIFSSMEVILKFLSLHGSLHPMQITMERFLIGGLCLIPFALRTLKKRQLHISKPHLRYFALTGFVCVPLSMVLYQLAVVYGKASVVAILFSGNPIFVTILAFLLLKEPIRWNNVLALALSVLGIIAIINPFSAGTEVNMTSVVLIILAALLFSLYSVLGKRMTKTYGGIVVTCMSFLFGGAELLLLLLLGYVGPVAQLYNTIGLSIFVEVPFIAGINAQSLPYFLTVCLINSAAGYVFHMMSLEKLGANTTNLVFFFKPILATVFAFLILKEAITASMLLGITFFLLGSLAGIIPGALRARKERQSTALPS